MTTATSPILLKWDPKSLEIRTLTVERLLEPLVTQRIHFERGTQNVEATPEHRANPYRPGAWLFTPDTEATLNRRAALIISPVDPVDRCTALCRSHRRLKHREAALSQRGASASGGGVARPPIERVAL
ncbi:unnamed protein product [Pleuronectes platessa]|uniref:Uncharacterized protein n=1 Tax=Pleuronectes platessa TaxID=8262 RepID=A0A9N7TG91_PLEPL|nr:unnamed protein product [Pleuronectes platessa]